MNRQEISGYAQLVVGLVGIVLTLATTPSILQAISAAQKSNPIPNQLEAFALEFRVFCVVMVLSVLVLLVLSGLALVLAVVAEKLGAKNAQLTSVFLVASSASAATTLTLSLFGDLLWVPGFVGSLGLALCTFAAARAAPESEDVGITGGIFVILFLITGVVTVTIQHSEERSEKCALNRELKGECSS